MCRALRAHRLVVILPLLVGLAAPALPGVASAGEPAASARGLTTRGLANLVAFTRLLGTVRYFHPSDEAAAADWDAFALAAVDTVERAAGPTQLAATLRRLFLPLAPTLVVDTRPAQLDAPGPGAPGAPVIALTEWIHHGCGLGVEPQPGVFRSERTRRPAGPRERLEPAPDEVLRADLGAGVWCALPRVLPCDSSGTLPRANLPAWEPAGPADRRPTGDDRATRLADVALFWNVPQHFYPYFDAVEVDWPAALREALGRAATDRDAGEFANTLRRLVARLRDGHGRVSGGGDGLAALPLAWAWVEERLVVTAVAESLAAGVRPGDVVLAIDGEPVAERLAACAPLIGHATPQHLRYLSGFWLMRGAGGDSVTLELQDPAGVPRRARLGRLRDARIVEDRPERIAALRPGIWYVDFDRATDADVADALDSLAAARGLVFDLRGYPSRISVDLLAHLAETTLTSPPWACPVVRWPDHRGLAFEFADFAVPPLQPRLRGRVAFIIDGRAISRAETYLAVVEQRRLGALVGEATAGTDGEVVTVPLPGGYRARFTGTKVLKHDGSRLHGVGVLPTVPVARTRAGVAAGRDELLDRAIEIVSR
jgi:hypothetical protein